MIASYNYWMVLMSVLVAIFASYTALNLATRITASKGRSAQVWLVGGAVAMGNDADSMAIVSTIISLGHSLKMKVIAEGVETEDQSNTLKLLRCDEMQGYLFSKPLPGEMLETRFLALPSWRVTGRMESLVTTDSVNPLRSIGTIQ